MAVKYSNSEYRVLTSNNMITGSGCMHDKIDTICLTEDSSGILTDGDDLNKGIWPKSRIIWMAVFYMMLFIIRPWEVLIPGMAVLHPEKVFAICMLLAIFISGKISFQMSWQSFTAIFFIFAIFVSGQCAYIPSLAWEPLYKYLSIFVFYLVLLMVVRSPYDLIFMVLSYVSIMCLYLAKSQWEYFINDRHRYTMGVPRLIGIEETFGGPNALAMSIVVSLPFALLLWRNRSTISSTWPEVWKIRFKRGLILYGILAVSSVILTNSRSGMVGFIAFCGILMFGGKGIGKKIKFIFIGLIILSLIWVFMPSGSKSRLKTIWDPEEGPDNAQVSAEGRVEGFKAGMEMFRRNPFTGVGVGNFVPYRIQQVDGVDLEAHNLPGQLLGEMGLLGGGAFLLLLGAIVANCRKVIRFANNESDTAIKLLRDLAKSCLASLFLLVLLGMSGHNLYRFNWLWIAAFSLLALQFVQERLKSIEKRGKT